jgi:hypothetical protein
MRTSAQERALLLKQIKMKLVKLFISLLFSFATYFVFSQKAELTKIYFKVKADCGCSFQLARNDKPAGQIFRMLSDSFLIAVDKETTGFFIICGKSNPVYLKIPYTPGQGFYRIAGIMPCGKNAKEKMSIESEKIMP